MADLFSPDRVLYICTCGVERPVTRIYFCRYCLKLRCGNCVWHEVDSHYCPNCLENMPSAEARVKKNRCGSCFDCPSCKHTLSTRASSIQVPNAEDNTKTIPKKVYYLACGFCRWTSRDAGLKDQDVASGGWQELENPHVTSINVLLDYYRSVAMQEKLEKEHRKTLRKYIQYSEKFCFSTLLSKKRVGLPTNILIGGDVGRTIELEPAVASEDVDPLPEEYLNEPVTLPLKCTLNQMLWQPEVQSKNTSELYPRHKHLLVKRSQRCRECDHSMSKPEFNPSSIKFKIQLSAFYHVPNVRLMNETELMLENETRTILTLTNPTQNTMHVFLKSANPDDKEQVGKINLPKEEIIVFPRDDTAEFDDLSDNSSCKDNPEIIAFRKANKVGVYVGITALIPRVDVRLPIVLRYDYLNTVPQADSTEPQITWLEHKLMINFGHA